MGERQWRTEDGNDVNKLVRLSERSRRNIDRLNKTLHLRKWKIWECTLRCIPVEECIDRVNQAIFMENKKRRYGIWIRVEAYASAVKMSYHLELPVCILIDAIFQTISPELVRSYFAKLNTQHPEYKMMNEYRPESVILQHKFPKIKYR